MSDTLFLNGPVQNRGYELDEMPGKASGIMLSHVLNQLHGNNQTVHLWNNVGTFHASEQASPTDRLGQKYSSETMQEYFRFWGIDPEEIDVLTDDDDSFANWSNRQLENLLESGTIYIDEADFDMCNNCEAVVAEAVVGVSNCTHCGEANLACVSQPALFVEVPKDKDELLDSNFIYNKMNLRNERDSLKQIPPRLLLSRDREIGVDLSPIGLAGKKLDPRMGIGMLTMYAAEKYDFETVAMAQTTSTLIRTAPYIGSVLLGSNDMRRLLYVPHTKIDDSVYANSDIRGRQVVAPFAAAQRNQDVDMQRFEMSKKEFDKLARNAEALRVVLDRLGADSTDLGEYPNIISENGLTDFVARAGKQSGRVLEELKRKQTIEYADQYVIKQARLIENQASRINF